MEYKEIQPSELRVGDIITAQFTNNIIDMPSRLFTDVTVLEVREDSVLAEGLLFWTDSNKFFLIERPKKPLPTEIGSVVEADGAKYVRVLEDNDLCNEWYYSVEGLVEDSSTEHLATLDYTIV